jgi:2-polyprenyl-3-methyl-5-hydroxy-6-metoxy-1,4-benzoquinol methylase
MKIFTSQDEKGSDTMERAEFLNKMRSMAEALYDHVSPQYWVKFGGEVDEPHLRYLQKFLEHIPPGGVVLSAACGAGRFDGLLVEAGHPVLGIDQAAGMLKQARQHFPLEDFPQLQYEKLGLQEMNFEAAFEGAICMDAMEHICPEDWPGIMRNFQKALKPGGLLYFTTDWDEPGKMESSYQRAQALGFPVVYGEVVDELEAAYAQAVAGGPVLDASVYHFHPPLQQVRAWVSQAGLTIIEVGTGSEYHHILARK